MKSSGKFNVNEAVVAGTEKRLISLAGQLGINDLVPIRVQSGLRRGLSLSDALTEAKGATQNPEWSAQVDKLAEAILPTGVEMKGNLPQNWTGQSLVDSKINGLTKRQVSEILSKEGIPGIKYLDAGSRGAGDGTRNYVVFDDKLISIIRKYGIAGASAMVGYDLMENLDPKQALAATMADREYKVNSAISETDEVEDALRVAKDVGGATSSPVMMEDAKGNKYDAQGNIIPPTAPGPNPQRTPTPQEVGQRAAQDPATFDAMMERYAVPDRDIADYKSTRAAVQQQPQQIQQMTHVGAKPRREMTINMPMFGGEYSMGTAPYDVASGLQGMAQGAYDFKTAPAYFFPPTAPFAFGADLLESRMADDPVGLALNLALTPQGASAAKSAGRTAMDVFRQNPKTIGAATGAGAATIASDEAEAGPARWFSKAVEAARAIPMNKMTGEQALAMLRKGTSPEELRWMGADVFLPQQKQITKQGLVDYLAKNRVQTSDVTFGGGKPTKREDVRPSETARAPFMEDWNILREKKKALDEEYYSLPWEEQVSRQNEFWSRQYQLDTARDALKSKMVDATIKEMGGLGEPLRYGPGSNYGEKYVTPGGADYRETLITLPTSEYGKLYQSGHWQDVPNVVGHIRTQVLDVTPPGANRPYKAFNVDEAQSDYAKAGREKGFGISKEEYEKVEMEALISRERLLQHYEKLPDRHRPTNEEIQSDISRMISGRPPVFINPEGPAKPLVDAFMNNYKTLERAANAIPTAPYVTSTQNWTDLSIKKSIDQALDAGADYFTFTPGEAQAARYDLSKYINTLSYNPNTGSLGAWDASGKRVIDESILDDSELDDYVGKELAEKLRSQVNELPVDEDTLKRKGYAKLSGLDLKVGGEGMIDYYNNIYKKRVEKVVKDATGKKVQWEVVPVQTADGPREQLGFRLTDDMKEARFSDFNKGGRVTGGNAYDSNSTVANALALTREY